MYYILYSEDKFKDQMNKGMSTGPSSVMKNGVVTRPWGLVSEMVKLGGEA